MDEEKILEAMTPEENEELSKKQRKAEKTVSRGFRASAEVQDKFHNIIDNKENGDIDDIVNDMCDAYLDKQFKKVNAPREKDIEEVENYLAAIDRKYKSAIDGLRLAEGNIRQEFANQLDGLTNALAKEQAKSKELEKTAADAIKEGEQAKKDAATIIEKNAAELENLKLRNEKNEATIVALKAKENEAAAEAAKQIAEAQAAADKKIAAAEVANEKRCTTLEKEISKLEGKIEALQEAAAAAAEKTAEKPAKAKK